MKFFLFSVALILTIRYATSHTKGKWLQQFAGDKMRESALFSNTTRPIINRFYVCKATIPDSTNRTGYATVDSNFRASNCSFAFDDEPHTTNQYHVLHNGSSNNTDEWRKYEWRGYANQYQGTWEIRDKVVASDKKDGQRTLFVCRVTLGPKLLSGTYDPRTGNCSVVYQSTVRTNGDGQTHPHVLGCVGCDFDDDGEEDG